MLEKYHETLACILGNSFLYGSDEQKAKVSKAISEVVNLVMYAHEWRIRMQLTNRLSTALERVSVCLIGSCSILNCKQNCQMLLGKLFLISLSLEKVG